MEVFGLTDVRKKTRIRKALLCCLSHERGAPEGTYPQNPCKQCEFDKDGSVCREELFRNIINYIDGINETIPVEIGYDEYGDDIPLCPICGKEIRTGDSYCSKCGTAMDWDDYPIYDEEDDGVAYDDYSETSFS